MATFYKLQKKWRRFIYGYNNRLPRQLPDDFLYERFVSVKDHRKKEIRETLIKISGEAVSIKTTIQQYAAASVYDKIEITGTTIKEEKYGPGSDDINWFWRILRKNKASLFPSPGTHNSHDSMTDQFSSDNRIFISYYKKGLQRKYEIFDGHDYSQGNLWSYRLDNIIAAEKQLIYQAAQLD